MFFGPGINWWYFGSPDIVPPSSSFWNANTGMSGLAGGDIDLISIFLIFGVSYAFFSS